MAEVTLISSCLVAASTTEANSGGAAISRVDLSPWDLQFILLDPIQRGLLYQNQNQDSQEFKKTIIDHLKTSLSRTLDFFPLFSGHIGTKKNNDDTICFFIDCNNAGAEFAHAIAQSVSVSDIMEPTYVPEIVSSFFSLNGVSNCDTSRPLLGVQVTELVDGFFLGITANHAVVDGESFWHFVNSWSEISRGFQVIFKPPVLERWFPSNLDSNHRVIPVPALIDGKNSFETTVNPPALLERFFHFSKESVAKLKEKANTEAGTNKISTLQSLLAHLWRSVMRGRGENNRTSEKKEIYFIMLIGARSRIPLPEGYFGNAVYGAVTSTNEHDLLEKGLGCAALKLHQLVCKQTSEVAVKFCENWAENPEIVSRSVKIDFVVGSSPRFDVYGNDFGWGKPVAVRGGKVHRFDGKMSIYQGAGPGSVDVEACLAPETMHALEDDAEFMQTVTI